MKKGTIILSVIFVIVLTLTITTAIKKLEKPKQKKDPEVQREVTIGNINVNISDLDNLKKTNATNYNIELLNNVEDYIKTNVDFDTMKVNESKFINSDDILKNDKCGGKVEVFKLINGIYSVDINTECEDDIEGITFSFKLFGNLDHNANIYKIDKLKDGAIAASYKNDGKKDVSSSIIKFDENMNIEWIYDINDKDFDIRQDNGLEVIKIIPNKDSYYVIGYLNDDFGSVFGIKLNDNGELIWQHTISQEMIVSDVAVISDELIIIDGKTINFIDDKGKLKDPVEMDLNSAKLPNFRLGKTIFYNNNIYSNNTKNSLSYAKFNSAGLVDQLYDLSGDVEVNGYLEDIKAYDNKLFFKYENNNIIVVDIFGRYVGEIKSDIFISQMNINSNDFDIIDYSNDYIKVDNYNYKLEKERTYELLKFSDKNVYSTDKKIYQYLCDKDYIVLAQFDK